MGKSKLSKDKRRRVELIFSCAFLSVALNLFLDYLTPVLDLEEMDVRSGVVKEVRQALRTGCGDVLVLQTEDGEEVKYDVCLDKTEGSEVANRPVTVWSQRKLSMFGYLDHIYHLQMGKRLMVNYRPTKKRRIARKTYWDPWFLSLITLVGVSPLIKIGWERYVAGRVSGNDSDGTKGEGT